MAQINKKKLKSTKYYELDASNIKANGWLEKQLDIQVNGITGDIEEIWVDVSNHSAWLNGTGENWERGPYYLDGLVPLAFLTNDEGLLEKVEKWIWTIYESQLEDGWFGPDNNDDWWPRMVALKAFQQYYEYTKDERILLFIKKYLDYMYINIDQNQLKDWGRSRVADNVYIVTWLFNIMEEEWLYDLGIKLLNQGFNWSKYFSNVPYTNPTGFYYDWNTIYGNIKYWQMYNMMGEFSTHTVNIAMGVKYPYYQYIFSQNDYALDNLINGVEDLMKYHGQIYGIWSGDEHLNGTNPSAGSELCSINEYLFSIEKVLREEKLAVLGDVAENLFYNAFFGTNDYKMNKHQYVQQANQVQITTGEKPWYNNKPDANQFGLEPEFGCCTANIHQGMPKFIQHLWYGKENGLYKAIYGPSKLITKINNIDVEIIEDTMYPFNNEITYKIQSSKAVKFDIDFRIPKWSRNGVEINNKVYREREIISFEINTATTKEVHIKFLGMDIEAHKGPNESIYFTRGPIILSLNIGEKWKLEKFPHLKEYANYEVLPATAWNYAININSLKVAELNVQDSDIYTKKGGILKVKAKGRKIDWQLEKNVAMEPPINPVYMGDEEEIELVAYGTTKLRLSCFPFYS